MLLIGHATGIGGVFVVVVFCEAFVCDTIVILCLPVYVYNVWMDGWRLNWLQEA